MILKNRCNNPSTRWSILLLLHMLCIHKLGYRSSKSGNGIADLTRTRRKPSECDRAAVQATQWISCRTKIQRYKYIIGKWPPRLLQSFIYTFILNNNNKKTPVNRNHLYFYSFQDVYNFVFCQPGSPDSFEITTNFPKRVLDTKDSMAHMTLSSVGLRNREVLFVNDLDA